MQAGLVALVRLARRTATAQTRRYFESIVRIWNEARNKYRASGHRDFTVIQHAENNMRRLFLKMVWESTRKYGNTEFKRVYSWREGSIGPLNGLLNYAGARLREVALTRYPFPEPRLFRVITADGQTRVLTEQLAERLHLNKTGYLRAGYAGNARTPRVFVTHPTLPSLDFVDMIRAHVVELCRQCFIHNVPRDDAHRYIRLLIHRLTPFLDWVYSGRRDGRKHFNHDGERELRTLVREIRALYGRRAGRAGSVTESLDDEVPSITMDLLEPILTDDETRTDPVRLQKRYITDRDIERLNEQVAAHSRREGNDWHSLLLSGLHHPKSLKQVVFQGDRMNTGGSPILPVAELPVGRGRGRADLVLFVRREVASRIRYTPVMILELKTKTAFDLSVFGARSRNKGKKDYVPVFRLQRRPMTEREWDHLSTADPAARTVQQLTAYETDLLREYEVLVQEDPVPPRALAKGVILIDTGQDRTAVYETLHGLLDELGRAIMDGRPVATGPLRLVPDSAVRLALHLLPPQPGVTGVADAMPLVSVPQDNPFAERTRDRCHFTLYVSVPTATSSGVPAARLATDWHLLHHIQECIDAEAGHITIYWLDLLGGLSASLLRTRLRLRGLFRQRRITRGQYLRLRDVLSRVKFVNIRAPDHIEGVVDLNIAEAVGDGAGKRLVVVDGWDQLSAMVPRARLDRLRALENDLLAALVRDNTEVIWLDTGVSHTLTDPYYQRRCVRPLPYDSPKRTVIDEVLYNLPCPPKTLGRVTPLREDLRVIVQDTPAASRPWNTVIHVPQLTGYARKFRGLSQRHGVVAEADIHDAEVRPMYGRGVTLSRITHQYSLTRRELVRRAMGLVPSLSRMRDRQETDARTSTFVPIAIAGTGSTETMAERVRLRTDLAPATPARAKNAYVYPGEITRGWRHKRRQQYALPNHVSRRPPVFAETDVARVDSGEVRRRERHRLLRTTRFLQDQPGHGAAFSDLLRTIEETVRDRRAPGHDVLADLTLVAEAIVSVGLGRRVWSALERDRQALPEVLNTRNRQVVLQALRSEEHLLLLYGNNLVLLVMSVMDRLGLRDDGTARALWSSIGEWELYQLGIVPDRQWKTKYDVHALYSNLMSRARVLGPGPVTGADTVPIGIGQIIETDTDDDYHWWLVVPGQHAMVALVHGVWYPPNERWQGCVTDPAYLIEESETAIESDSRTLVVVDDAAGLLWLRGAEDEWAMATLHHSHVTGDPPILSWLKTTGLHRTEGPPIDVAEREEQVDRAVDDLLQNLARLLRAVVTVTCGVTVDDTRGTYVVVLSGPGVHETREFSSTEELVRFVRRGRRTGGPYRTARGTPVRWELDAVELEDRLSFLSPVVRRARYLPGVYRLPKTCRDYLCCSQERQAGLSLLPGGTGRFRVVFAAVAEDSWVKQLERLELTLDEVGLLAECTRLVDVEHEVVYTIALHVDEIREHVGRVERYPRLLDALMDS